MRERVSPSPQSPDDVERRKQHSHGKLMQHQEAALQLAQKINQIIADGVTPAIILKEIAKVLGTAFQVDGCCLVTVPDELSTDDGGIRPVQLKALSNEDISAYWCTQEYMDLPHPNDGFAGEQLDAPVLEFATEPTIEDISTTRNSWVMGYQYLPLPIKSVLAIRTRFAGKKNGVVSLIQSHPYDWSEAEKQLLKSVESACAIAFSRVMEAQLINSQQQELRSCAQHQSLIRQLTILSRSNLELNQMLQLAIASTAEALQADRGLLLLLKYTDPLFRNRPRQEIPKAKATVMAEWSRDSFGVSKPEAEKSFMVAECGLCQRAFKDSAKPVIINNYLEYKESFTTAPILALEELPAILFIPLENQGRVLGFLALQQAKSRHWQASELNIVEMVCAQMTNAIIQSQTLRQVQSLVDERTAQLQRSLEVQSKLYEIKQQHVKQLQELNELKDEFVSNMSDRLRYPLTNMRVALRNLRHPNITPDKQVRYLDILEQECTKEINLINDLLTLQKLESHQEKPQFETIDLNTKIQELQANFETKLADKGLKISLDLPEKSLSIQTEIESFDRILQELLTNTSKFSEADTVVQLQAEHQVQEQVDKIVIQVTNIGRGISEEEATYIFDRFRRGRGRWTPGTGLGLALVKSMVQHLNGAIAVESTPIPDTELSKVCFTLTLPQYSDDNQP
ncbi:GAF domain-containing sensor histidine kinase [Calothrix sp. 336/3]|nr:GAF domain-containing sensor histidine kinase [Calothrix sp. 336/3]